MRNRWLCALATATALVLCVSAADAQAQQQAGPKGPALREQSRGSKEPALPDRPARVNGHPNFNGIWQALNTAYWNLEDHSAEGLKDIWQLGAIGAIPAGQSVVRGGTIPYTPAALAKRNDNRAKWPATDPEAKCYMLGVPRVTYHNLPFQIFQAEGDLLMVYPFAAVNRVIYMSDRSELPVDSWMGKSDGTWEGDVLVVTTKWQNGQSWLDRAGNHASHQLTVTERFRLLSPNHMSYEATLDDPQTFTRPWTIEMPLYRLIEQHAQLLEHKCVPFADGLLYQDLLRKDSTEERR
jgi:hypothetical protein